MCSQIYLKSAVLQIIFPNVSMLDLVSDYVVLYSALAVFKSSAKLHPENQEKIANHLLQQLTPDAISNFVLQLMVSNYVPLSLLQGRNVCF